MDKEDWLKTYLEAEFSGIKCQLTEMRADIMGLKQWRWKVVGAGTAIGILVGFVLKVIFYP